MVTNGEIKMISLSEDDSDQDDVFVVRRRKSMVRLTKQKALEIKKIVLEKQIPKDSSNSENVIAYLNESQNKNSGIKLTDTNQKRKRTIDDGDDVSILEERINTSYGNGYTGSRQKRDRTPVKNKTTPEKSPSKLISDYFIPKKTATCQRSLLVVSGEASIVEEPRKSGPGGNKQIKIKCGDISGILDGSPKKEIKKRQSDERSSKSNVSPNSANRDLVVSPSKRTQIYLSSHTYSKSLKGIIHNEILKQSLLEQQAAREGKHFGRLFTQSEIEDVERFFKLPDNCFEMFARMLCRKKGWHRICSIHYGDIEGQSGDIFKVLNRKNFVDLDVDKESVEVQLNLLGKTEIQVLCKVLNIRLIGKGTRKRDYIDMILKSRKSQRSVADMWRRNEASKREQLLKTEIMKLLGPCMKLNESFLRVLHRILLLFCLPSWISEEDKWSSQIRMVNEVCLSKASFPNYEIKPTVIFNNRDDFIGYEKAIEVVSQYEDALLNKNHEELTAVANDAKIEFRKLLWDEGLRKRIKQLPQFLWKYNAGSLYAKVLMRHCEKYRKQKDQEEIVDIMEMLINQDSFSIRKKGFCYYLLIQAYSDLGRLSEACSVLLTALKEDSINEVEKLQLQLQGSVILRRRRNGLGKGVLRDELDDACSVDLTEPSKIEIKARTMDKNESGYKSVYMYKDKGGALTFSSVEETVIDHYKANGFAHGVHAEGFIIQTMYFLVFFDIIYKVSPVGVFQNPYQTHPLDFLSRSFYLNRKKEIDFRLEEMRSWSMKKFEDIMTSVYVENFGVRCVITWRDGYDPKLFCEIFRCLGCHKFTKICERLVQNFKVYRSGFPDLTIWNPATRKLKFVEVKSPNDKLSPNQRLWLDFLKKINVDCEVCNVKNIASRLI